MNVSSTTTPNVSKGIEAIKKAIETEENSVSKILEDSARQQKEIEKIQQQRQQQVAEQTGLGINLNITV